jgi:ribosomal protein S18 acetylase RimI-like enzyme
MSRVRIRPPHDYELPLLQDIERAAGVCFRDIGMPEVADDAPLPVDELARYHQAGTAWATVDTTDGPVGYLIADVIDGNLHIEQVSVHPQHSRHGLGRRLIDHAAQHAQAHRLPALTLTTFTHVPWNAPYYLRCGFRILTTDSLTPGLHAIRRAEAAHGLDRWPRVCMRRDL